MAVTFNSNHNALGFPTHHYALSRHFFQAWCLRNGRRQQLWQSETSLFVEDNVNKPHLHFDSLHKKIQHLKDEIIGLMAQDTALFHQLFDLQEAMSEFKEQMEDSSSVSSGMTTPYLESRCATPTYLKSTCSTLSSTRSLQEDKLANSVTCFVRQRVSYPPVARNRSRRTLTTTPTSPSHRDTQGGWHGCQDSYDSGIHTSDLEIFV